MSQFWTGFVVGLATLPLALTLFAAVARTLRFGDVSVRIGKDEENHK